MKKIKQIEVVVPDEVGNQINYLIGLFEKVNPCYQMLFKRRNQRDALQRLIDNPKLGFSQVCKAINILPQSNEAPYAPTITTPADLEYKLASLIAFVKKQRIIKKSKGKAIL